jgi:LysM repeat protein
MRRGLVIALNVMLIFGSIACLGSQTLRSETVSEQKNTIVGEQQSQGADSPVVTPTVQPEITPSPMPEDSSESTAPADTGGGPQMPLMLYFAVPESIELAPLIPVPLIIFGDDVIQQATVEVQIFSAYFKVRDEDLETPGTQVMPGLMPEGGMVLQNVVEEDGTLRYQVSGLGAGSQLTRTLLTFHLESANPAQEILRFDFLNAAFLRADGTPLDVQTQSTWVEVMPPTAGEPAPTVVVQPTLTVQPAPVPVATGEVTTTWRGSHILPGIYYRIQQGQTLFRVAEAFDVSVEALAAANGIVDASQVSAGMLLHIPTSPPSGQAAYFVAPRETLYSIARRFGLTVEILAGYNQLTPPYSVQAGQWVILVP